MNPHIFRAYDIRGIADPPKGQQPDLTEKTAYIIGKAVGIYLRKKYKARKMAVGCDNRLTSEKLKSAYIKGVAETGIKVSDIGLSISPMIYWATCALDFDCGTNITASHNPKQYNGIKIVSKNAHSICGEEIQKIRKITRKLFPKKFPLSKKGVTVKTKLNLWPQYLSDLTSRVSLKRKLKIVVDAGNGTAGKFAPELLRKIGCEVIPLYCELDGTFPNHEPNPEEPENMKDLIKKVLKHKADLGIGFDGDGDRIGVIDEKGKMYFADYMLLLLAQDLLKRAPKAKIVFDTKVSQIIINKMESLGAIPIMSKTGHSFIEKKIKKTHALLGGETSGHLFFAENYYGFDDGFLAACKILEILSASKIPLSQAFKDLPKTYTTPEIRVFCPDDKKFKIIKKLAAYFTKNYDCITIDGVRINFGKNSWGAIRASNTSPNLTLRFEAPTLSEFKKIQKIVFEQLKKYHLFRSPKRE